MFPPRMEGFRAHGWTGGEYPTAVQLVRCTVARAQREYDEDVRQLAAEGRHRLYMWDSGEYHRLGAGRERVVRISLPRGDDGGGSGGTGGGGGGVSWWGDSESSDCHTWSDGSGSDCSDRGRRPRPTKSKL